MPESDWAGRECSLLLSGPALRCDRMTTVASWLDKKSYWQESSRPETTPSITKPALRDTLLMDQQVRSEAHAKALTQ